jgi:hypothetical protein
LRAFDADGILNRMRLAFFSAFLLLGLVPGLAGAIEDAAHLLAEGHTLHDGQHDTSASADHDEHERGSGCEDCGHDGLCHCHGGASLAAAPTTLKVDTMPTLQLLQALR